MTRSRGFTLIEMVVAVALLAVLAAVAYATLDGMLRQQSATATRVDNHAGWQRMMLLLSNDLFQVVPRSIRSGSHGDRVAAFNAPPGPDGMVEWTRGGWPNPAGHARSTYQRVAWRIVDGELQRLYWVTLDRDAVAQPVVAPVVRGVQALRWRFLAVDGRWHDYWPVLDEPETELDRLPRAVELTLLLEDGNELRRIFDLPAG